MRAERIFGRALARKVEVERFTSHKTILNRFVRQSADTPNNPRERSRVPFNANKSIEGWSEVANLTNKHFMLF